MPAPIREQISAAFFDLVAGAADFTATSRRFVHWDQVNETQMPFLTMLKTGEVRGRQAEGLPTLTINAHVFIYMSAGMDPEDVPDTAMNALLDAVDAAVVPTGADALVGEPPHHLLVGIDGPDFDDMTALAVKHFGNAHGGLPREN